MIRRVGRSYWILAVALWVALPNAYGEVIRFEPDPLNLTAGESFTLQLLGEGFDQGVTGGSFQIDFDQSVVHIANVSINTVIFEFGSLNGDWDNNTGTVRGSTFNTLVDGNVSSFLIATIDVVGVGLGNAVLNLERGPFNVSDFDGNNINSQVTFSDGTVTVVPEPATAALLIIGLLAVGLLRQKRHRSAI